MSEQVVHGQIGAMADAEQIRRIERAREVLVAQLVGLGATMCAAMDAHEGFVPCEHAFGVVIEGTAAACACEDETRLEELTAAVRARSEHVAEHRGVAMGASAHVDMTDVDAVSLLLCVLGGAPRMARAMRVGVMSQEANVALVRALACLGERGRDLAPCVRELSGAIARLAL